MMRAEAIASSDELQKRASERTLHGFYLVAEEAYHRGPGLSRSGLVEFARSPHHYLHDKTRSFEPTRPMVIGSAFHCLVLEPALFRNRYWIPDEPRIPRNTKAGKEQEIAWDRAAAGKTVLTEQEMETLIAMSEGLGNKETALQLLRLPGLTETAGYWEEDGILCRLKPDHVTDCGIMIDIKTTTDASHDEFAYKCAKRRYHWQPAFYGMGYEKITQRKITDNVFIVVETEPPYECAIYRMSDRVVEIGRQELAHQLQSYRQCLAADMWTGYPDEVQDIELPGWRFKK